MGRLKVVAIAAILLFWFTFEGQGQGRRTSSTPCYRVKLENPPSWVGEALAIEGGSKLILVDSAQSRLMSYNKNGKFLGTLPKPGAWKELDPNAIASLSGGNFLIELVDGRLVYADHALNIIKIDSQVVGIAPEVGLRIGSLFQWKVAGQSLIAYGSLHGKDGSGNVLEGLIRIPLWGKIQKPVQLASFNADYYLAGNSYITTIGETAYYVAMDRLSTAIFRVSPTGRPEKLSMFPAAFKAAPALRIKPSGPDSAARHFAEWERLSIVTGIYSQGGLLYLLVREPRNDQTVWSLYKIDPSGKQPIASIRLPVRANHLSVAVSDVNWFFVERGPVGARQRQEVLGLTVVESSAIRDFVNLPVQCSAKDGN